MDIIEVKETVLNFNYYLEECNRLGSLSDLGNIDVMISSSRKEAQTRKRIEKMDRKTTALLLGMEKANLTDKEWTVLDLSIEGMSQEAIGKVIGHSGVHVGRHLSAGCKKIADFLSGKD